MDLSNIEFHFPPQRDFYQLSCLSNTIKKEDKQKSEMPPLSLQSNGTGRLIVLNHDMKLSIL